MNVALFHMFTTFMTFMMIVGFIAFASWDISTTCTTFTTFTRTFILCSLQELRRTAMFTLTCTTCTFQRLTGTGIQKDAVLNVKELLADARRVALRRCFK